MISYSALQLLEFDRLLSIIAGSAHSEVSRNAVLDISPLPAAEDVRDRVSLIEDIRRIIQQGSSLHFQEFHDIGPLLARVRPAGAVLEAVEIAGFIPLLDMSREISTQVSGAEKCKALGRLTLDLTGQPDLLRTIVKSVDHEGNIRDNASSALRTSLNNLKSPCPAQDGK